MVTMHSNMKKYDISIESIKLTVQLQSDNQLDVKSNLTIHNGDAPVNEVYLTLYHGLQVILKLRVCMIRIWLTFILKI